MDKDRVGELYSGFDQTLWCSPQPLNPATKLEFISDKAKLGSFEVFIITAPTPIDATYRPNLTLLIFASRIVGEQLRPFIIVIYESTVYPALIEEVCVLALEEFSGLTLNENF